MKTPPPNPDEIGFPESAYLYTALSGLPHAGNGLFTAIPIYRQEVIAVYTGEILTDAQALARSASGNDKYFISMLNGTIMDSMHTAGFAKYANDAAGMPGSALRNNSKIGLNEAGRVCIMATRNIKAGEEIFCGYGKRYWKKHA